VSVVGDRGGRVARGFDRVRFAGDEMWVDNLEFAGKILMMLNMSRRWTADGKEHGDTRWEDCSMWAGDGREGEERQGGVVLVARDTVGEL
jgi:hypothetical protein